MNQFQSKSTGSAILKNAYPDKKPLSVLSDALMKRRRKRAKNRGMKGGDSEKIESANMGYKRGLLA